MARRIPHLLIAVAALLATAAPPPLLAQGPAEAADVAPPALDHGWPVARPSEVGLDPAALAELAREMAGGEHGLIDSFLVIRDGRLVFERYYRGFNPYVMHTLQSVTKSVSSTLIGLAAEAGAIDLDAPISDYFPEYRHLFEADPRKAAITVENLLTMTTGIDWPEHDVPYDAETNLAWDLEAAYDWPGFVLRQPMAAEPGNHFNYSTGVSTVLGALLQNATGMSTQDFAQHYLFDPLGVPLSAWWRNTEHPDHWAHTGGGLHLMPRDLAKVGYLYINDGVWQGNRILSTEWIERATKAHLPTGRSPTESYGYQWWLRPLASEGGAGTGPNDIIHAAGWGGQHMFVVPAHDLVVVFTSSNFTDKALERRPVSLLYERVLPAVLP